MQFNLAKSIPILERGPSVYHELLHGLDDDWVYATEGGSSWSAFDIVGHLIHGEKTDWIPRARIILGKVTETTITPFDMEAHFEASKGKNLGALLDEFALLRKNNLIELRSWNLTKEQLQLPGLHPEFGTITLQNHLACWIIHDLSHINQISRVLVKQYKDAVGPWAKYFSILKKD